MNIYYLNKNGTNSIQGNDAINNAIKGAILGRSLTANEYCAFGTCRDPATVNSHRA